MKRVATQILFLIFIFLFQKLSAQNISENLSYISMSDLSAIFEQISENDPEFLEFIKQLDEQKKTCVLTDQVLAAIFLPVVVVLGFVFVLLAGCLCVLYCIEKNIPEVQADDPVQYVVSPEVDPVLPLNEI